MKKFAFLAPFFVVAACGGIDNFNLGQSAIAQDVDCNEGGAGGNGSTSGGVPNNCACDCGDSDGSRLKVQWVVNDDGSRMRRHNFWYDSKMNELCVFQSMPNGETRCLPPHSTVNAYLDSSCTKPFYVQSATKLDCDKPAKYVRVDTVDYSDLTCGGTKTGFVLYQVDLGNKIEKGGAGGGWWHKEPNGDCQGTNVSLNHEYAFYGIFPVGDEKAFVKSELEGF